jgi:hypothetical protein
MMSVKQCSVLLVNSGNRSYAEQLRQMGFAVREMPEWPDDDRVPLDFEAIVIGLRNLARAPIDAARIRAKPGFGRRVLMAVVPHGTPAEVCREGRAAGFDDVVLETFDSRTFAARMLNRMRTRPELRCTLPSGERRRAAA